MYITCDSVRGLLLDSHGHDPAGSSTIFFNEEVLQHLVVPAHFTTERAEDVVARVHHVLVRRKVLRALGVELVARARDRGVSGVGLRPRDDDPAAVAELEPHVRQRQDVVLDHHDAVGLLELAHELEAVDLEHARRIVQCHQKVLLQRVWLASADL